MVKVRATAKGYVGGVIREQGDVFEWPDADKLGSWVKPFAFGGKGDHDGDGVTGGSVPATPAPEPKTVKSGRGGKAGKVETVNAPTAEPFADAPVPETLSDNGIQTALGGVQPDWLPPGSDGADEPVMADD